MGKCCFYNIELEGYNVILSNQPCKYLDRDTMKCKIYKNRFKINPYCLHSEDENMFNKGSLPKGCLFLEKHPEREKNPKIDIREIADNLSHQSIMIYNMVNNIEHIEQFAIKRDD